MRSNLIDRCNNNEQKNINLLENKQPHFQSDVNSGEIQFCKCYKVLLKFISKKKKEKVKIIIKLSFTFIYHHNTKQNNKKTHTHKHTFY